MFVSKQKTAFGVRISDWSSDVCSSDLFGQQVEYIRLYGYIQCGDGLVADNDFRHARQRSCYIGALFLAAGKFMRISVREFFVQAYPIHQPSYLVFSLAARHAAFDIQWLSAARDRKSTRLNSSH